MTTRRSSRPARLPEAVARLALGGDVLAVVKRGAALIVIRSDAKRALGDYAAALAELFQRKDNNK